MMIALVSANFNCPNILYFSNKLDIMRNIKNMF